MFVYNQCYISINNKQYNTCDIIIHCSGKETLKQVNRQPPQHPLKIKARNNLRNQSRLRLTLKA